MISKPHNLTYLFCLVFIFYQGYSSFAQVGIGNTSPNSDALLEVGDGTDTGGVILPRVALTATDNFSPMSAHIQGMSVYNTAINGTGYTAVSPGQYYNNGTNWKRVGSNEDLIDSVTLAADYSLGTGAFSDVPDMSLTFVARKTTVLIILSGSGDTNATLATGIGDFQVYNVTDNSTFGGTHEKLTTWDDVYGIRGAAWSINFTKPLIGLTIGNSYTIKVQALFDPTLTYVGIPAKLQIFPVTSPGDHHLTLSVMQ